jgi:hypothetical protein
MQLQLIGQKSVARIPFCNLYVDSKNVDSRKIDFISSWLLEVANRNKDIKSFVDIVRQHNGVSLWRICSGHIHFILEDDLPVDVIATAKENLIILVGRGEILGVQFSTSLVEHIFKNPIIWVANRKFLVEKRVHFNFSSDSDMVVIKRRQLI